MIYRGLYNQIRRNNLNSILLLLAFPLLLLALCYAIIWFATGRNDYREPGYDANTLFLQVIPFVLIAVALWFIIAWLGHSA